MLLILRSWPIFVYAITISIESILIEPLTSSLRIPAILISATSITLAGVLLLLTSSLLYRSIKIATAVQRTSHIFSKSKKNLLYASIALAIGIFTWYDSISRVGASKEVLIAGPLEIILIVLLAYIFLREKLDRLQIIGISVAIIGFFLAVASDINYDNSQFVLSIVTFGDIEAMISALGFAVGVLFLAKLVLIHPPIHVAGASLITAGLILIGFLIVYITVFGYQILYFRELPVSIYPIVIISLLLFAWLPFIGAFSYSVGLDRLGAALTGTIGSSSIFLTLLLQIFLNQSGILTSNLPENIILAGLGSLIGFLGIVIIHIPKRNYETDVNKKRGDVNR